MDIFISYSSKDIDLVKKMCVLLREHDFSYWVAHENGNFGEHYATTIITQITEAKIFLVFVSNSSNLSTHVINEINSAVMRDKLIIPVIIDDVKLSPAMEYYLASNHYLIYSETKEFEIQLTNRISALLGLEVNNAIQVTSSGTHSECEELINKANEGDLAAICELGRRYYNGTHGLNKNLQLAFSYFMQAAEKEYPDAQCNVAWCYEVGDGVEEDLSKAFEWYTKSAQNDCSMAQYSLGWMYSNGVFVPRNQSKAIEWFVKAAEQGHGMAQYKLGMAYQEGIGVDQSDVIANHWLMLSADQGIVFAQYQLAENYYHGRGCKQDIIKAKQMWLLSSERGFEKSALALEKYYDIYYLDENKSFLV